MDNSKENRVICARLLESGAVSVAVKGFAMLAYLAILGAALAGYSGIAPYAIAVSAVTLSSISYSENFDLYRRGRELGLSGTLNIVLLRSLFNGLLVAALAYLGGWAFNWL